MLGQMAKKYFGLQGYTVTSFDERFDYANRGSYRCFLRAVRGAVVINCIGKIKQKSDNTTDLLLANTVLPAELRNCLGDEVILVHPSTDCVFRGDLGSPYPSTYLTDAEDDYGWSKRLGEVVLTGRDNTLVPRVSIIGPDENLGGKGLMAWVMSQAAGSSINGYKNHLWNGITTLEWCKQVEGFISRNNNFDFRLLQYGTSEYYSKYDLLVLFSKVFNLRLSIDPIETATPIDRRLLPDINCKSLSIQLEELKKL